MRYRHLSLLAASLLAAVWLLAVDSSVLAGGYQDSFFSNADHSASVLASEVYTPFNSPSSFAQCMGYGVGAGYHAPLVFGQACSWRASQRGLVWLPASPAPCSHGCNDWSEPSFYGSGYNSGYAPPSGLAYSQPVAQQFHGQPGYGSGPTLAPPLPQNAIFSPPPMPQSQKKSQQPNSPPAPRRPAEPISPSDDSNGDSDDELETLPMPSI